MESYNNISHVFIPFCYSDQDAFGTLVRTLQADESWTLVHDEITYMLKYVADKIDSNNPDNCQCFHFALTEQARASLGVVSPEDWCHITREYRDAPEEYRFQIKQIQLYCFSTTVCILAFQLRFEKNDPLWVSSAQYYLKKVSRENIYHTCAQTGLTPAPFTLLELAKGLMRQLDAGLSFQFFFYANPTTERANFLTLLEVEQKADYRYELYYLRRCYGSGFLYTENQALDRQEIYSSSQDTVWGVSPEAAVCLVCPSLGRSDFLRGTFYRNFNAQYLFMYVLLLHQKYVLYMFLTQIGVGSQNNLAALEQYRRQLYEFETNFVFSCVTEVPQYQNLYERMTQAFALQKLYEDVREPIVSLTEIRQSTAESKQKNRDKRTNKALFMLSLLSFFSALIDSFDFVDSFFAWFLGADGIKMVQVFFILVIIAALVFVMINLFHSGDD